MGKKKMQKRESPIQSPTQEDAKEKMPIAMGKKKMQKRESPIQSPTQEDAKEQLASLKALNNLLVRETVERREQIDFLQKSNEALKTQLAESVAEARTLDAEKSMCEDHITASKVEQDIFALVVASELGRLKEDMRVKIADAEKMVAAEAELKTAMTEIVKSMEREREDAKVELKSLQMTITELQKKKNFWTWMSSAAAIVAVASVAFITRRGH